MRNFKFDYLLLCQITQGFVYRCQVPPDYQKPTYF